MLFRSVLTKLCRTLCALAAGWLIATAGAARLEAAQVTLTWDSSNTNRWQLANTFGYWINCPGKGIYHNTDAGNTAHKPPYDYANQMIVSFNDSCVRDTVLLRFPVDTALANAAAGRKIVAINSATLSFTTWFNWGARTFHVSEVLSNWNQTTLTWGSGLHQAIRRDTPGAPRLYTGTHPGSGPNHPVVADVTATFTNHKIGRAHV